MKRLGWLVTSSLSLGIAIALVLGFGGDVSALRLSMSLDELADGADSIVVGTVASSSSHWNTDHTSIYTEVVISVEDTLKGPAGKNTMTIIVPGGKVGDSWQWVEDTPVFEAGEKVGLFLKELNSGGLARMGLETMPQQLAAGSPSSVYGGSQGKLSFTEDKAGTRSRMSPNEFRQNVNLALAGRPIPQEQSLPLVIEGAAAPTISSISPSTASAGTNTLVTVSGSDFGTRGANDHLAFYFKTSGDGDSYMASQIVSWSDTQIEAYVPVAIIDGYPYSAASGPVAVYKHGSWSNLTSFTVTFGYGQLKWAGASPTLTYEVNEGGVPGRLAAVQSAANSWNNAGANFSFSYGGATSATTKSLNGENEVLWQALGTGILGEATMWGSGSTITECDFAFSTNFAWNTESSCPSDQYDVQSIGAHELGHWLCLRDLYGPSLQLPTPNDSTKVMYGYGGSGQTKRTLHAHDIAGIQWIYGVPSAQNLAFTTQPSSSNTAGTAFTTQPVVTVQDASGNTVTTSTAAVTLGITPGTGTEGALLLGTKTVNAVNGIATFSGLSIDLAGTGYTLTAASSDLTSANSDTLDVEEMTTDVDILITLQGFSRPESGWVIPVTVKFFTPGVNVLTATPLYTFPAMTNKVEGMAACTVGPIPVGTYDITLDSGTEVESGTTLMNVQRGAVIAVSGMPVDMGTLLEGDADNNGTIDVTDFGIFQTAFMSSDPAADFDRNGIVDISDFGLLAVNFMKTSPVEVP
ncbi:MAG: IPT/TIG domain-containing protein [Dehalococcoidia bacterium]|nr:IPT/TIG domain-containing protein [Dehalococcoidia bacterium]